jgi:hypothetical protein
LSRVAAETSGFLYADLSALVFHAIRYIYHRNFKSYFFQ